MNEHRVAQIMVPTTEVSASGSRIYSFGSGYLIADDLVLTARHVVLPDNRDLEQPIEVRFTKTATDRWYKASVEWAERPELDAAILRLAEQPEGLQLHDRPFLSSWIPATGSIWDARGHPWVARSERPGGELRWPIEPFQGGTVRHHRDDTECTLDVRVPPRNPEGWKGLSGAAVVAADQPSRLLAVVSELATSFDGRLRATPAVKLLNEPAVLQLLDQHNLVTAVEEQVISQLRRGGDELLQALAPLLKPMDRDPPPAKVEETAELLLWSLSLDQALDLLYDLHQKLHRNGKARAVRAVEEIVWLVLPCLFEPGMVRSLSSAEQGAALHLSVPVDTMTMVEVVSAGIDRRATRFVAPRRRKDYPDGRARVEPPPECGIDAELTAYVRDMRRHLANALLDEADHDDTEDNVTDFINDELEWRAGARGGQTRHYLVIEHHEDGRGRAQAKRLAEVFPALRIFCLAPCERESKRRERTLIRPLRDLLLGSDDEEER